MANDGEIPEDLLLDSTEIITLIITRNLNSDRMPITFLKDGKTRTFLKAGNKAAGSDNQRASLMKKMRELLAGRKNLRKPEVSVIRGSGSGKVLRDRIH